MDDQTYRKLRALVLGKVRQFGLIKTQNSTELARELLDDLTNETWLWLSVERDIQFSGKERIPENDLTNAVTTSVYRLIGRGAQQTAYHTGMTNLPVETPVWTESIPAGLFHEDDGVRKIKLKVHEALAKCSRETEQILSHVFLTQTSDDGGWNPDTGVVKFSSIKALPQFSEARDYQIRVAYTHALGEFKTIWEKMNA